MAKPKASAAARPVAPAAPARPMGPPKPGAPKPQAAPLPPSITPQPPQAGPVGRPLPGRPTRPGAANNVAPSPQGPTPREAELAAEIAGLRAELSRLTKAAAKASAGPRARTLDEIINGVFTVGDDGTWDRPLLPGITPDDWRKPYHGQTLYVKAWKRTGNNGKLEVTSGHSYPVLLAVPRDADGAYGPAGRNTGELAMHRAPDENGHYVGTPHFINQEELAELWDDERNG